MEAVNAAVESVRRRDSHAPASLAGAREASGSRTLFPIRQDGNINTATSRPAATSHHHQPQHHFHLRSALSSTPVIAPLHDPPHLARATMFAARANQENAVHEQQTAKSLTAGGKGLLAPKTPFGKARNNENAAQAQAKTAGGKAGRADVFVTPASMCCQRQPRL